MSESGGVRRYLFLDAYRGLAVLWMIETHVFLVGLGSVYKEGGLAHWVLNSNGYVANAFAFCAGCGFWLAASAKPDLARFGSPVFLKFLRRSLFILLTAYWLNVGTLMYRHLREASGAYLLQIFQSDILHVIAFSSLISLGVLMLLKDLRRVSWCLFVLGLAVILLTPWVWSRAPLESWPLWAAMLVVKIPPGKFPLFPWMAYYFAGVWFSEILFQVKHPKRWAFAILLVALAMPLLIERIGAQNWTYPGMTGLDWYPSPGHTFYRLNGVVFVFALFFLFEPILNRAGVLSRFLQKNGQESLSIYVLQVFLIYVLSIWLDGSSRALVRLNPLESALATAALVVVCFAYAMVWRWVKKLSPDGGTRILGGVILVELARLAWGLWRG